MSGNELSQNLRGQLATKPRHQAVRKATRTLYSTADVPSSALEHGITHANHVTR